MAKKQQPEDRDHEAWDAVSDHCGAGGEVVDPRVLPECGDHAEDQAQSDRDEEREESDGGADRRLTDQKGGDLYAAVHERLAQIAANNAVDPVQVLLLQRQVEAVMVELRSQGLRALAGLVQERVARDLVEE